ncbi:MAG: hypothetical protein AAB443_02325 [Patescibacteria group bacterium]
MDNKFAMGWKQINCKPYYSKEVRKSKKSIVRFILALTGSTLILDFGILIGKLAGR